MGILSGLMGNASVVSNESLQFMLVEILQLNNEFF